MHDTIAATLSDLIRLHYKWCISLEGQLQQHSHATATHACAMRALFRLCDVQTVSLLLRM